MAWRYTIPKEWTASRSVVPPSVSPVQTHSSPHQLNIASWESDDQTGNPNVTSWPQNGAEQSPNVSDVHWREHGDMDESSQESYGLPLITNVRSRWTDGDSDIASEK